MQTPEKNVTCYNCEAKLELLPEQKVLRHEECDKCMVSLHVCKMCIFYDLTAYNECREPSAERILEKEKANFCSYYILKEDEGHNKNTKGDQLSAANSLFKN